jgi:hypothetical protein
LRLRAVEAVLAAEVAAASTRTKASTGQVDVLELDELASIYRQSVESFIPPKGK